MMQKEKEAEVEVVKKEEHVPAEVDVVKEEEPEERIMWMGTEVASPIPIEQLFGMTKTLPKDR